MHRMAAEIHVHITLIQLIFLRSSQIIRFLVGDRRRQGVRVASFSHRVALEQGC